METAPFAAPTPLLDRCTDTSLIPQAIRERYTQDGPKYDLSSPVVQAAAARVRGSSHNLPEAVRGAYDLVAGSLRYELHSANDPASKVLGRGVGCCAEYAFAMIAICRALGIPARWCASARAGRPAGEDRCLPLLARGLLPPASAGCPLTRPSGASRRTVPRTLAPTASAWSQRSPCSPATTTPPLSTSYAYRWLPAGEQWPLVTDALATNWEEAR